MNLFDVLSTRSVCVIRPIGRALNMESLILRRGGPLFEGNIQPTSIQLSLAFHSMAVNGLRVTKSGCNDVISILTRLLLLWYRR